MDKNSSTSINLQQYKNMNKDYIDAYKQLDAAKEKIDIRLKRLKNEQDLIKGGPNLIIPQQLAERHKLMNPSLYSYQFHEPLYYPLENPINGEPVTLPKIELGQPLTYDDEKKKDGLSLSDIIGLLSLMNNKGDNSDLKDLLMQKMKGQDEKLEEKKKVQPIKKLGDKKKDWWKIVRAFVNVHNF